MKLFLPKLFLLTAFLLVFGNTQTTAQSSDDVTVVQKVTHEDGVVTVKKKKLKAGNSLDAYIKALELENSEGQHVEIKVQTENGLQEIICQNNDGKDETVLFIRRAKEDAQDEVESLKVILGCDKSDNDDDDDSHEANNWNWDWKWDKEKHHDNHKAKHNYGYSYSYSYSYGHSNSDPKKTFLGIYLDEDKNKEGVYVDGIVAGSGASAAGLREGDVITAINGNDIQDRTDLRFELNNYEPNTSVAITYLRNGQVRSTNATLTAEPTSYRKERDPCKVFIGVYVGRTGPNGKGVRASGIIDNTPAFNSNIQRGDYILALDGVPTNSHSQLLTERNKHEPGDYFTMTVLRGEEVMEVDAQFKECPKDEPLEEEPVVEEIVEPEVEIEQDALIVEDLNAYPNPTYGNLNITFKGEAVPTSLIVTNIMGQEVYSEELNNFSGEYGKRIDISNSSPGTHIVTVRQGDKVFTKSIILVVRA